MRITHLHSGVGILQKNVLCLFFQDGSTKSQCPMGQQRVQVPGQDDGQRQLRRPGGLQMQGVCKVGYSSIFNLQRNFVTDRRIVDVDDGGPGAMSQQLQRL